jgi:hypothetical protein
MTAFKQEAGSDIYVATKDAAGHTMIVELPSANCDSTAQPILRSKMTTARNAFVAARGQPTGSYHTISSARRRARATPSVRQLA